MTADLRTGSYPVSPGGVGTAEPRRPTVLLADGRGMVLVRLGLALQEHGFVTLIACDGFQAVTTYLQSRASIDLVVLAVV
ncbi:MAG: hypothetical protein ACRC33_14075, partial [Gemmataceae bacterium]